jgi:hypothetical protein
MDTFVKLALGLKKGIGKFKVALNGKMTEHLCFFERKTRFPAFNKELYPTPPFFLF